MEPRSSEKAKYTLLLVDDNEQNLELLEIYMADVKDARVITARNGVEAMEAVARHRPDLILLDIMMPKMSGFEACKRLKNNPDTRDIVVVMVTALSETGDVERALECGADEYITKPIDRDGLLSMVRSHLGAR